MPCLVELSLPWLSEEEVVLSASFAGFVVAVEADLGLAMLERIDGVQSGIVVV